VAWPVAVAELIPTVVRHMAAKPRSGSRSAVQRLGTDAVKLSGMRAPGVTCVTVTLRQTEHGHCTFHPREQT
jgi:hypothetical protein